MPDAQVIDFLTQGGAVAVLAFGVVALWKEWLVPGGRVTRLEAEKEEWKKLAVELLQTTDRAVSLVERP